MRKNNKGSVTIMAFVVMLFISLYGALILGNSARKYQLQTNNIETIVRAYRFQGTDVNSKDGELSQQELRRIYYNVGGTRIENENGKSGD